MANRSRTTKVKKPATNKAKPAPKTTKPVARNAKAPIVEKKAGLPTAKSALYAVEQGRKGLEDHLNSGLFSPRIPRRGFLVKRSGRRITVEVA